jgi:hypothetical protein
LPMHGQNCAAYFENGRDLLQTADEGG